MAKKPSSFSPDDWSRRVEEHRRQLGWRGCGRSLSDFELRINLEELDRLKSTPEIRRMILEDMGRGNRN